MTKKSPQGNRKGLGLIYRSPYAMDSQNKPIITEKEGLQNNVDIYW